MKLEHIAFNVKDPIAVSQWYQQHLGLRSVKQSNEAPYTTFLADDSGQMLIEIYCNPANEVPEYHTMNALQLHIAFVSEDADTDRDRLLKAGATLDKDLRLDDGSHLVMLRDPWGLAIQFCKRSKSLLSL